MICSVDGDWLFISKFHLFCLCRNIGRCSGESGAGANICFLPGTGYVSSPSPCDLVARLVRLYAGQLGIHTAHLGGYVCPFLRYVSHESLNFPDASKKLLETPWRQKAIYIHANMYTCTSPLKGLAGESRLHSTVARQLQHLVSTRNVSHTYFTQRQRTRMCMYVHTYIHAYPWAHTCVIEPLTLISICLTLWCAREYMYILP